MHFKEENITGTKLTHMTHSEDLIWYGPEAINLMYEAFLDTFNSLKGSTDHKMRTTVKIDGAPAAFCASNYHGKSFVATKGIFAKTPKVAFTEKDCDALYESPDLAAKMKTLLKWVPYIGIPKDQVWTGDFLFAKDDIRKAEFDGEPCIMFRPNTLVYTIPENDPIAKTMLRADIGICWHSRYTGNIWNEAERKISFDVSVDELQNIPSVFQMDVNIPNIAGRVTLTEDESTDINSRLILLKKNLETLLQNKMYYVLIQDDDISKKFISYENKAVKEKNSQNLTEQDFIDIVDEYNKATEIHINNLKRTSDISRNRAKQAVFNKKMVEYKDTILDIWKVQEQAVYIKEFFIKKLNKVAVLKTFVQSIDKGFIPCSNEGFAISDIDGNVFKMVSRLEFSKNNFSQAIVKGWTSEKREKESIEDVLKRFLNKPLKLNEDILEDIQNTIEPIYDEIGVENKKPAEIMGRKNNPQGMRYTLMPDNKGGSREDKATSAEKFLNDTENVNDVFLFYKGTTPMVTATVNTEDKEDAKIELTFKPPIYGGTGDALSTEADEVYWAYCMSLYNIRNFAEFPTEETDFEEVDLTTLGLRPNQKPKESNRKGYIEGTRVLLENDNYIDSNDLYAFNREGTTIIGGRLENNRKSIHDIINRGAVRIMGKGSKKDSWNPADVVAYKVSEYQNILDELNDLNRRERNIKDGQNGFKDFNEFLNRRFADKSLVCISLKDIRSGNSTIEIVPQNINGENPEKYQFNNCSINNIKIPALLLRSEADRMYGRKKGKVSGISVEINNETENEGTSIIDLDYRQSGASNLNIEAKEKGSNARLGKTPKFIYNNLLKNVLEDAVANELTKTEVERILFEDPEEMLNKIRAINESGLNLIYPANSNGYELTEENWIKFTDRIKNIKNRKPNKPSINLEDSYGMDMNDISMVEDDFISNSDFSKDLCTLYIWPRLIDFIYLLIYNPSKTSFIIKSLLQGASKTYVGCPPFIKIC